LAALPDVDAAGAGDDELSLAEEELPLAAGDEDPSFAEEPEEDVSDAVADLRLSVR
jgi:hypothetical protein